VIQSFEPGESWFLDHVREDYTEGPELAPPQAHPLTQPVPGPTGRIPAGWMSRLH
jgi:hypothetical protein